MMGLRLTRRHWSGRPQDFGERASPGTGWILLAFVVGATVVTILAG